MLLRVAAETDAAERDLKAMVKRLREFREAADLNEHINLGVLSIAFSVTTDAMKEIGRPFFLPGDRLPDDAQFIVAFAFLVAMALYGPLKAEGYQLEFADACVGVAHMFVTMHDHEIRAQLYERSASLFQYVIHSETPKSRGWRESLEKLVYLYIVERNSADQKIKAERFPALFGSMLKTFLSAAERASDSAR
jgi:hypothetical protein